MTNEELKNMLFIIDTLLDDAITDSTRQKVKDKLTEVCKLAIQALDAQPTDAVSRSELMNLYKEWQPRLATNVYEFGQALADLPSVTPKAEPCEDCISILNRIMEYTYGMLTAEKIGLQHLIKSMIDEMSGGGKE